jgi:hypothetical protein
LNGYYDKQGNPIDLWRWGELHEDLDYIVVEKTPLMYNDEPVEVSTVWLGINHQWGEGPPIIFETMVFGGPDDGDQWRYSTEKEARDGHAVIVHELVNRAARDRTEQGEE